MGRGFIEDSEANVVLRYPAHLDLGVRACSWVQWRALPWRPLEQLVVIWLWLFGVTLFNSVHQVRVIFEIDV